MRNSKNKTRTIDARCILSLDRNEQLTVVVVVHDTFNVEEFTAASIEYYLTRQQSHNNIINMDLP